MYIDICICIHLCVLMYPEVLFSRRDCSGYFLRQIMIGTNSMDNFTTYIKNIVVLRFAPEKWKTGLKLTFRNHQNGGRALSLTFSNVYIHLYIYIYVFTYICTCLCTYIHIYKQTNIYTNNYIYYVYTYIHIYTYTYMYLCTSLIHIYTHLYITRSMCN